MKRNSNLRNYLSALTLSTLLAACSSDSIVLEGTVKNLAGRPLVYTRTIGGIHLAKLDTVAVRPDSTFRITLPADGVERINFYPPERGIRSLFLRPGQVQLDIDATATHPLGAPDTPERRLAEALSELDHNVWDLRTRQGDAWNVTKDTIASSVRTTLQEAADAYESALATVDEEVRALAAADIRMQLLLAFEQQHMATTFRPVTDTLKQAWNAELERMADWSDVGRPAATASPAFADAVSNLTGIRLYYVEQHPLAKNMDEGNRILFDRYEQTLDGSLREAAWASLIWEDYFEERNSPGIPALYDRFLARYPDSPLKPALDEAIAVNRAFHEVALSPDVHILETASVRSLAELLQPYRGRVVFIDLWATWCGPCRASFAHVAPLQEYAAANDVVLLYLSIDRPSERDKWVKMANVYHLKGEHVLVGDGFRNEIYKTFGKDGYLMIPHCAVVDREGHIRFPKAAPVEQWDELQKQLEQAAQPLPAESLPFVDAPVIQPEK